MYNYSLMYKQYFKRLLDLCIATISLLLLSPIFILLCIILSITYKGNPFFFQKRPGYKGHIFSVIKFKSMADLYDKQGALLPDYLRLTKIGSFLRKTSLDELPQLINVIKNDMSFIGPRPLLVRYLPFYSEREFTRHNVRPGMTGLAQISGRNFLKWEDRLEFDAYYVENLTFKLDAKIFIRTIQKVIQRSDIKIIPDGKPLDVYRKEKQSINNALV
ncbi:sugar transferase [Rubrolithibacter danxiaensis]|uniref:sugar transferase n=1 Tax=Rubrolithibacter danxiaensis TaxID=3390805 RepID=UPI003BF7AAEE